ncbi:MAG: hypothetical protein D3913_14530, partial [Candidatus Electrothrix sp. LOE1_4_5]|nr:hypothetical protein [Candidatus Electrothrix gigas]
MYVLPEKTVNLTSCSYSPYSSHYQYLILVLFFFSLSILLFLFAPLPTQAAQNASSDIVVRKTMLSFSKIPNLTQQELEYG